MPHLAPFRGLKGDWKGTEGTWAKKLAGQLNQIARMLRIVEVHGSGIEAKWSREGLVLDTTNITAGSGFQRGMTLIWEKWVEGGVDKGGVTDIPDGWALCDGAEHTAPNGDTVTVPDRLGLYPVCYDANDDDYDALGEGCNTNDFVGFKVHGGGTNDHEQHALDHIHEFATTIGEFAGIDTTSDGNPDGTIIRTVPPCYIDSFPVTRIDDNGTPGNTADDTYFAETTGVYDWLDGNGAGPPAYRQPSEPTDTPPNRASHSETDNRPPSYVSAFIMKL